jgi:membrane protease YdiL (CAAX protease family)
MKKIAYFITIVGWLALASTVFAVTIPDPLGGKTFGKLLTDIALGVGTLIAGLSTIMFMIAGIMFLFSAGSPDRINKAKAALTYAIIGIVIGLAADAIVTTIKQIIGVT